MRPPNMTSDETTGPTQNAGGTPPVIVTRVGPATDTFSMFHQTSRENAMELQTRAAEGTAFSLPRPPSPPARPANQQPDLNLGVPSGLEEGADPNPNPATSVPESSLTPTLREGSLMNARLIAPQMLTPTPAELAHGIPVQLIVDSISEDTPPPIEPLEVVNIAVARNPEHRENPANTLKVIGAVDIRVTTPSGAALVNGSTGDTGTKSLLFATANVPLCRACWQSLVTQDIAFEANERLTIRDSLSAGWRAITGEDRTTNAAVAFLLETASIGRTDDFAVGYLLGPQDFANRLATNKIAKSRQFVSSNGVREVIHTVARWQSDPEPKFSDTHELVEKAVALTSTHLKYRATSERAFKSEVTQFMQKVANLPMPISGASPEYFWQGRLLGLTYGIFVAGIYRAGADIAAKDKMRAKLASAGLDAVLSGVAAGLGAPGAAIELVKPFVLAAAEHYLEKRSRDFAGVARRTEASITEAMLRVKADAIDKAQRRVGGAGLKHDVASAVDWFALALKYGAS